MKPLLLFGGAAVAVVGAFGMLCFVVGVHETVKEKRAAKAAASEPRNEEASVSEESPVVAETTVVVETPTVIVESPKQSEIKPSEAPKKRQDAGGPQNNKEKKVRRAYEQIIRELDPESERLFESSFNILDAAIIECQNPAVSQEMTDVMANIILGTTELKRARPKLENLIRKGFGGQSYQNAMSGADGFLKAVRLYRAIRSNEIQHMTS